MRLQRHFERALARVSAQPIGQLSQLRARISTRFFQRWRIVHPPAVPEHGQEKVLAHDRRLYEILAPERVRDELTSVCVATNLERAGDRCLRRRIAEFDLRGPLRFACTPQRRESCFTAVGSDA